MPVIDLNADLGETPGDLALVQLVTSANIACGGHAGDDSTMAAACDEAARYGTAIGAHPGYPDRAGMGRVELGLTPAAVVDIVCEQVGHLGAVASAAGARLRYVKLHGALYHRAHREPELAEPLARALAALGPVLAVLAQPGSALLEAAAGFGLPVASEAFCDRTYTATGELVDRAMPGAVIDDPERSSRQALSIATQGGARTADGGWVAVPARSLCLHGDTPGALAAARRIRSALLDAGVTFAPFAP